MTVDQGLALVGIVVAVLIGVASLFFAKSVNEKRSTQVQKISKGASGIQSGGDTKIGKI